MTATIEGVRPPTTGQVEIAIKISAAVNVSAFAARQKLNGFLVDEVSLNLHAGEPSLVVGERLTWRAPIVLSIPPRGDLGAVGDMDVDVQTGEILYTRQLIQDIKHRA